MEVGLATFSSRSGSSITEPGYKPVRVEIEKTWVTMLVTMKNHGEWNVGSSLNYVPQWPIELREKWSTPRSHFRDRGSLNSSDQIMHWCNAIHKVAFPSPLTFLIPFLTARCPVRTSCLQSFILSLFFIRLETWHPISTLSSSSAHCYLLQVSMPTLLHLPKACTAVMWAFFDLPYCVICFEEGRMFFTRVM